MPHRDDIAHRKIHPSEQPLVIAKIVMQRTDFVWSATTVEARSVLPPNPEGNSIWDVIKDRALSTEDNKALKAHTEAQGGINFSTLFSRAAAGFLDETDAPDFKTGRS